MGTKPEIITQKATNEIIEVLSKPENNGYDRQAAVIIISAIEKALGCRETADAIAETFKNSTDINSDMFLTIRELCQNTHFYPSTDLLSSIDTYLDRISSRFEKETGEDDEVFQFDTPNSDIEEERHEPC